jgi:predicted DNA-binding transcriptional regulator AlpA
MSKQPPAKQTQPTSTSAQAARREGLTARAPSFDSLPNSAYIREAQLIQSPKRPTSLAPLPFSAPTLWRKVKAGTFPRPIKLSERVTCWNVGEVRSWINAQATA